MKPLISVIIPVYNREKYLHKCVNSVLTQTYANLEILLIDDGSTDNSRKILDDYAVKDSRVKVIYKNNGGVSSARNYGLKFAKGEYIGFVDSDDYIEPDMYEYLYNLITVYEGNISVCAVTDKPTLIKTQKPLAIPSIKAFTLLYKQSYVCNKLFCARIIKNIRFREDIIICEDMLFCFQAFVNANKIIYGPQKKYHYVNNINSATCRHNFSAKKFSYFKANDELLLYAKRYKLISLYIKILQSRAYMICGFLRQIVETNFQDINIQKKLIKDLRKIIFLHLISPYTLRNKLFGLMCCINFNFATKIYKQVYHK